MPAFSSSPPFLCRHLISTFFSFSPHYIISNTFIDYAYCITSNKVTDKDKDEVLTFNYDNDEDTDMGYRVVANEGTNLR